MIDIEGRGAPSVVIEGAGNCADHMDCTTDECQNAGLCAAVCVNSYPDCGLSDGCCGPACDSETDPDCPACLDRGQACTTDPECCSGKCHPQRRTCN